ncbi:unnamed protein product (macronuclear) [Paramecium tetraurelia]|uniref:Protein-serine/threonine phosphatase n=1 Tax=Paramecium tetraurelia TaxID=5888 RepID=A0DLB2_PARTE|nr:uncharacterized protein GSPATT00018146001 [Paramecium tetraurelia]CAK83829.1 unnamed protein product [Paramecium tetraurelia]|eukprot:XP_001451226.1 hypothetical protein (macronuclear) [Paramecium tetraurelia strain d4-2]
MYKEIYGCTLIHPSKYTEKGNLFVGGIKSLDQIQKHKFGAIISAVEKLDKQIPDYIHHLRIVAYDEPNFNLSEHFEQTTSFIKQHLESTNVLVHCQVGVSRSVSLLMAYFIKELHMTPDAALQYIKNKRDFVCPNEGFQQQLRIYYDKCQENNKID